MLREPEGSAPQTCRRDPVRRSETWRIRHGPRAPEGSTPQTCPKGPAIRGTARCGVTLPALPCLLPHTPSHTCTPHAPAPTLSYGRTSHSLRAPPTTTTSPSVLPTFERSTPAPHLVVRAHVIQLEQPRLGADPEDEALLVKTRDGVAGSAQQPLTDVGPEVPQPHCLVLQIKAQKMGGGVWATSTAGRRPPGARWGTASTCAYR
eukprot:350242-Chlamydomonas_euryale.AAC.17